MEWLYNKNGQAVFFLYDNRIISRDGENLCWVIDGCIYSLHRGQHIGWFEDGVVFDINNGILAFSKNAKRLPYRPGLMGTPGYPGIPGRPGMPGRSGVYGRPGYHGFSTYNAVDYFLERK